MQIMTAVKENVSIFPLIHVSRITPQVVKSLINPAYSVAKRRPRLCRTVSLLLNATNSNKLCVRVYND